MLCSIAARFLASLHCPAQPPAGLSAQRHPLLLKECTRKLRSESKFKYTGCNYTEEWKDKRAGEKNPQSDNLLTSATFRCFGDWGPDWGGDLGGDNGPALVVAKRVTLMAAACQMASTCQKRMEPAITPYGG